MTFGYGLGFGTGIYGTNTNINYGALNNATNSIMNQINGLSASPFGQMTIQGTSANWFNQIANCFDVSGFNAFANMGLSFNGGARSSGTTSASSGTTLVERSEEEEKAEKEKEAKAVKTQEEANEICEELFVAMKGAGTDNKALKAALARITKDNVVEVMETYINLYSDSMDGETLIESIQDEVYWGWFNDDLEKMTADLTDKLAERAKDEGLDAEGKACRAKVKAENGRWWNTRDEHVATNVNTLLAALIAKKNEG